LAEQQKGGEGLLMDVPRFEEWHHLRRESLYISRPSLSQVYGGEIERNPRRVESDPLLDEAVACFPQRCFRPIEMAEVASDPSFQPVEADEGGLFAEGQIAAPGLLQDLECLLGAAALVQDGSREAGLDGSAIYANQ
jgi:hypothetical protein